MDVDKAIKTRHSVRKFSSKKVDWKKVIEAIDYARLGPLAGNIPSLKFLYVDDKEKIKKLATASQQGFVSTAKCVVVVCTNNSQTITSYDERGNTYTQQQAGAAIENFWLKLTELGLSTCWVGAFVDEQVKNILKIPDNIQVEAFFPIGYEQGKTKQRPKPDLENSIFFNTWGNKYMKEGIRVEA